MRRPVFLQAYSRPDYRADTVIVFGSQLENTPLSQAQVALPRQWAAEYAWPRLAFTTFKDAMASLQQQFHGNLPVYRGDFGPYWEDGFASDALHTAIDRRNQQRFSPRKRWRRFRPFSIPLCVRIEPRLPMHGTTCCSSTSTPGPRPAQPRSLKATRIAFNSIKSSLSL